MISFPNPTYTAKIPDHLAVGSFVVVLEVEGVDYTENVTFTAMEHPSYTFALPYFTVDQSGFELHFTIIIWNTPSNHLLCLIFHAAWCGVNLMCGCNSFIVKILQIVPFVDRSNNDSKKVNES